jgi:hypothetical protein
MARAVKNSFVEEVLRRARRRRRVGSIVYNPEYYIGLIVL